MLNSVKSWSITCGLRLNRLDNSVQFRLYSVIVLLSYHERSVGRPSLLDCTEGHAAAFAVNAALMVSQRQHRAWTVPLHPPINAGNEVGQVPFFKQMKTMDATEKSLHASCITGVANLSLTRIDQKISWYLAIDRSVTKPHKYGMS